MLLDAHGIFLEIEEEGGRQQLETVNLGRAGVTPQNWVGTCTQSTEVGTMCNRNGREVSQSVLHPGGLSLSKGLRSHYQHPYP